MTCPVPRESDSERILKWLDHKTIQKGERRWWHDRYQRWMLPGCFNFLGTEECSADPSLDYLVLEKVRQEHLIVRELFHAGLQVMWLERSRDERCCPLEYLPGDYAEAARFLWEDA